MKTKTTVRGLPLITYAPRGRGGIRLPIHCVLHAKRGDGVQIARKTAYVINGRPLTCFIEYCAINGVLQPPRFIVYIAYFQP